MSASAPGLHVILVSSPNQGGIREGKSHCKCVSRNWVTLELLSLEVYKGNGSAISRQMTAVWKDFYHCTFNQTYESHSTVKQA